jgi:MoaA/NifB/PqqE/SkfB family radical SAM enzyme
MDLANLWRYRRIVFARRFAAALWKSRRNVIRAQAEMPPAWGPFMAELDVTYQCNCRCGMCQRWRDSRRDELSLDEYERLARAFHKLGVYQVSIAGGEPLLREDVFPIIDRFAARGMSVNVCTNGLLLERYIDQLCHSGARCVTVSLDGATTRSHDAIRGIEGSHEQIERGIRALAARPARFRPLVRVRMTVSNRNVNELNAFYRKWEREVDHVLLQAVHACDSAYYVGSDPELMRLDPEKLVGHLDGASFRKDAYTRELLESLQQKGTFPHHRCYAGILMARIDPWGNVYPCLEQHVCVGSIREQSFEAIWHSHGFHQARAQLATDHQCGCWYNNTALIARYARLLGRTGIRVRLSTEGTSSLAEPTC